MKSTPKKRSAPPVIDPYLPHNDNFGYRVSRYELELEYKVSSNRLGGTATITATTLASLQNFTLDLADTLSVAKVTVNGRRPEHFATSAGKLRIKLAAALPAGPVKTGHIRCIAQPALARGAPRA